MSSQKVDVHVRMLTGADYLSSPGNLAIFGDLLWEIGQLNFISQMVQGPDSMR